jgi:hypothetical protein
MELSREKVAEVTLQWSLMYWVSGTQFYRRASYVSSVVYVAQWMQEGGATLTKSLFTPVPLKGLAVPGT